MERVGVVVVGAGVMGSAAARVLGARGVRTVLLEQFGLGHARGSSHGATRIFRFVYPDPGYVRMALAAREAWLQLEAAAGQELLVTTGGVDAGPDAEACAAALRACGVRHSWLTGGELRERFPQVAAEPGERMLFQPDAGTLLAGRAVAALQELARRDGVSIADQTPVLGLDPAGEGVLVRTAAGEISARVAVVAAGGWNGPLLAGVVPRVPRLTVTLQQIRYFSARAEDGGSAQAGDRWPTFIESQAGRPTWYTVPAAGEAPGVKVASHAPGRVVDPGAGPFDRIDPALEAEAAQYVRRRLPGLDPAGFGAETCLYTWTENEDFVVDRVGPVVVGGGGSGHAFKFGPVLGEMLADLAMGQEPRVPLDRFSLSRTPSAGPA
ncbi:MAG TPA: N-methyl-L-tryptophan oxidase [Streptosporangiaceae bacterium]|nr:N-methyl-L-tryptophan oxidase [Streptosporangiaceae bacterium]